MQQISRDKTDRLQSATAEFTTSALDGYGLRCQLPARPAPYASYPVLVHRLASLLHASFRPHLTMTPLRFAITSPPSGCEGDLHPQAVNHARRTKSEAGACAPASLSTPSRLCDLEVELGANLNDARFVCCSDLSEVAVFQRRVDTSEVGVVKGVEVLSA